MGKPGNAPQPTGSLRKNFRGNLFDRLGLAGGGGEEGKRGSPMPMLEGEEGGFMNCYPLGGDLYGGGTREAGAWVRQRRTRKLVKSLAAAASPSELTG